MGADPCCLCRFIGVAHATPAREYSPPCRWPSTSENRECVTAARKEGFFARIWLDAARQRNTLGMIGLLRILNSGNDLLIIYMTSCRLDLGFDHA